ncbi:DUF5343 domain-containing protein [Gaoshiqia sp. Z1-71]|uniref:DUF5343 domain-containing protein n=1 Tax=Gaoshiqia hydrogeniformans TaxID=3290090 RepID=UPI003BF8C1E6
MAKENKTFPNIPVSHWKSLRTQFKKSIPGTISTNYLASILGMTEVSAKTNIMTPLKMIGLIDDNGNVDQDMARKYRDDIQYPDLCKDLINKIYPKELLDAFPEPNPDRLKIKSWFMNHTGVGSNGADRIIAFYLTLLEADTSNTTESTKKTVKKVKTEPKAQKPSPQVESKPKIEKPIENIQKPNTNPNPNPNPNLPGLNINIQVHISSDATPDQIEKIFEAMGKHLYNR